MSNWQQKIEAQIEELRDYKCISLQCCNKQNAAADTMQALLDVAVAADAVDRAFYSHEPRYFQVHHSLATELENALDKLREVDDG